MKKDDLYVVLVLGQQVLLPFVLKSFFGNLITYLNLKKEL